MNRLVRQAGSGFVEYHWPKPGCTAPVAKISYVKLFEPWGRVVGTGIYLDDVDVIFWQSARRLSLWLGGLSAVIGLIVLGLARSITRPMDILRNLGQVMARTQTDGDLTREVPVDGDDEISAVTRSFNQLLGSFRRSMHDVLDHLGHHQDCEGHQGHRGPDESVGAECRHRGCASR